MDQLKNAAFKEAHRYRTLFVLEDYDFIKLIFSFYLKTTATGEKSQFVFSFLLAKQYDDLPKC